MLKKITILFFILFSLNSFSENQELYKERMKNLIKEIKLNSSKNKILIIQNGSEVFFKDEVIDENFIVDIDGISQESLFYGEEGKIGEKTSKKAREYLLNNLVKIKEKGIVVFDVNYSNSKRNRKEIEKKNKKYGFIGEEINKFSADTFNVPINDFNKEDISKLSDVKNFLYLLNPQKFENIEEYFRALCNTDYDMLIIEPSYNGKFFTKKQIEKLKYKYNGSRRLVIAYFSIGEIEDYRYYWKKEWNKRLPKWIEKENSNWKGNFIVQYWSDEWRKLVKDYQKKLDEINVDGYYLDTIDSFYYFEEKIKE
jgi:cysteinyl-tRNA synthetase